MKVLVLPDGSKEMWPTDENDVKVMLALGGKVTWSLMQDTAHMQDRIGGGMYFRSEEKQKQDDGTQPKALMHDEEIERLLESFQTQIDTVKAERKSKKGKKNAK